MAPSEPKSIFRFSLAGVQPKLSVHLDDDLRATVPLSGAGGRWIAKLPSRQHPGLTRVELAVMRWAAASGFEVPETALIPLADISGVPSAFATVDEPVFLCRRCDRTDERRLHQEDLAQVCDVPPGAKYGESGIDLVRLSRVMQRVLGDEGHVLFLRRLVFDLACGNGDAHLKNWSLLYRVPHRPSLAPCYDLVATILYLPDDRPALHYPGKPGFRQVDTPCFRKLLRQTGSDTEDIWTALRQTLEAIRDAWSAHRPELSLTDDEAARIEAHMDAVPLLRELAGPRRS
jgi:serine/threonine-protein kinase HipA